MLKKSLHDLTLDLLVLSDMFSPSIEFLARNNDWGYVIGAVNNLNWVRSRRVPSANTAGDIYWHARTGRWK